MPPDRRVKPPRACAQSARRLRGGKSSRVGKGLGHRAKQQHAQAPGQGWRAHKRGERGGAESPGRGGGHSRRCRHPKPPGINPAQQNAGSRRQTPKNNKTPHLPQRRSRACDPILTRRKRAPRSRSPAQQHRGTQWSFGTLFEGLRGGGRRICTRN